MNGIRIDLDLSAFFTDIRKFSRVYLTYQECLTIKDVEEHIKGTFNITGPIVLLSDKYLLPSSQSVNILQPSEHLRVIRGETVLHGENTVSVDGSSFDESHCVYSIPCCMNKKRESEEKCELYSSSSKRRRDAFDINISSEEVSVNKKHKSKKMKQGLVEVLNDTGNCYEYTEETRNDDYKSKKKLRGKVKIFSVKGKNETSEVIKIKKNRDCIPIEYSRDYALQQNGREVSDIVKPWSEIMEDEHITTYSKRERKTENDVSEESVGNIQKKLNTLSGADEFETKCKNKKTENVTNSRNIDIIQSNLSTLSDACEVKTKHKKKGTHKEIGNGSHQTELSTKNDAETKEMDISSASNVANSSKHEDISEAEIMHSPKKSRKRIRKRKSKNRCLSIEGAKMLYQKVREISEKEMITAAEELTPEVKQNIHIFFDDDLGDNMLSIMVGKEPHMTEPLQTSNKSVATEGDSKPEENLLPPVSVYDNGMLPSNLQDIAASQNNKCDSDNVKPDVENTSHTGHAVDLKLKRALARARASLNSIFPEIEKVKESVSATGKNEESEETSTSDNFLQSSLLLLMNNIKEKPPVFERKKKASEVETCQENARQFPRGMNNNDHDHMEKSKTEASLEDDEYNNALTQSSASEKTVQTNVKSVEPSSGKFDINAYPVIDKFNAGDAILFKILHLNKSYEPVLSGHIFGKVLEVFDKKGSLKLEVLRGLHEFKEDLPPGKFSVYDDIIGDEENSNKHIKEIECNRILEPRLLYP